jgi:AcrR family transcriptional regulator
MPPQGKAGRYHHGDLRTALIDAAVSLIAERGVRGFSLAEASRRVGVSSAAPYRHFADRDDLLAAVAVRALETFTSMVAEEAMRGEREAVVTPEQRLSAMARAYVRFAAQQRPLFDALFGAGLDKSRYPELTRAWAPIDEFFDLVSQICDGDEAAAEVLAEALEATAHGYAALLRDGEYGTGPEAVSVAAGKAAAATLALIAGRQALR